MYADPKKVRDNRQVVYLNDYTHDRLMQLVETIGGQKGVVARDAMERGLELLLHELESRSPSFNLTGPNAAHTNA